MSVERPRRPISDEHIGEIIAAGELRRTLTAKVLARKYGISYQTVHDIWSKGRVRKGGAQSARSRST